MTFENKEWQGIYYTRYIASWTKIHTRAAKRVFFDDMFIEWLMSLNINGQRMPEEVAREIRNLATNGKLELEEHCRSFLESKLN